MKMAIATDHGGYRYKEKIKAHLASCGHDVRDFGTDSEQPVDYPAIMRAAALAVASGECALGIVLGGSGNGEAIVANKVRGIRCCVCWCVDAARLAREHNDANMISIGQRLVPESEVLAIVDAWLGARFEGGRHARRIGQIETAV
jgi:ribose 5-phosphate isomerase B